MVSKCHDCNASWICKQSTNYDGIDNRESYILSCKYYKSNKDSNDKESIENILLPFDKYHVKPEFLKEALT